MELINTELKLEHNLMVQTVIKDISMDRLFQRFLSSSMDIEKFNDWFCVYFTSDKNEIVRRNELLKFLSKKENSMKKINLILSSLRSMEDCFCQLNHTKHPYLYFVNLKSILKLYIDSIDAALDLFSNSPEDNIKSIWKKIEQEKETVSYKSIVEFYTQYLNELPILKNVSIGVNLDEMGNNTHLSILGFNDGLTDTISFFQNMEKCNSLCSKSSVNNHIEFVQIEEYIICQYEKKISRYLHSLKKASSKIKLDIIYSWHSWIKNVEYYQIGLQYISALQESNINYCFPTFTQQGFLAKKMIYPYMALQNTDAIPQDFSFSNSDIVFICGINGSGKTTFLKSLCQNILLAQLGFPVLADNFKFFPYDQILSVFEAGEDPEQTVSRYQQEAALIEQVLEKANTNTLLVFNEPFTSTNPVEASNLLSKILIELQKKSTTQIIVTHLQDAFFILKDNQTNNLESYNMVSTVEEDDKVFHSYILNRKNPNRNNQVRFLLQKYGLTIDKLVSNQCEVKQIIDFLKKE